VTRKTTVAVHDETPQGPGLSELAHDVVDKAATWTASSRPIVLRESPSTATMASTWRAGSLANTKQSFAMRLFAVAGSRNWRGPEKAPSPDVVSLQHL
jgi:hypothetical protein